MNLVQILQAFIDHRFEVVTRRAEFERENIRDEKRRTPPTLGDVPFR